MERCDYVKEKIEMNRFLYFPVVPTCGMAPVRAAPSSMQNLALGSLSPMAWVANIPDENASAIRNGGSTCLKFSHLRLCWRLTI